MRFEQYCTLGKVLQSELSPPPPISWIEARLHSNLPLGTVGTNTHLSLSWPCTQYVLASTSRHMPSMGGKIKVSSWDIVTMFAIIAI